MDKFTPRRTARQNVRAIVIFISVSAAYAVGWALWSWWMSRNPPPDGNWPGLAHFMFGLLVPLLVMGACLGLAVAVTFGREKFITPSAGWRRLTALEDAALMAAMDFVAPTNHDAIEQMFTADVDLRVFGPDGYVAFLSSQPDLRADDDVISKHATLWTVEGLTEPVPAVVWFDDGRLHALEFVIVGDDAGRVRWMTAPAVEAGAPVPNAWRVSPPQLPPDSAVGSTGFTIPAIRA
jgi:hypothetical protein